MLLANINIFNEKNSFRIFFLNSKSKFRVKNKIHSRIVVNTVKCTIRTAVFLISKSNWKGREMSRYNVDISIDNNYNSFLHLEIKMISNKKLRHIRLIIDFHLILLSVPTLGRLMSLFSIELINHCSKRRRHQRFFLYFSKYFMHHIIWADFFLSVFF